MTGISDLGNTLGDLFGKGANWVMGGVDEGLSMGSDAINIITGNKSAQQILNEKYDNKPLVVPRTYGPPDLSKKKITKPSKPTPTKVYQAPPMVVNAGNNVGGAVSNVTHGITGVVDSIAGKLSGGVKNATSGYAMLIYGLIGLIIVKKVL